MQHKFWAFLLCLLFKSSLIIGQSPYLDLSYGNDGVASVDSIGAPFFLVINSSLDSENRYYFRTYKVPADIDSNSVNSHLSRLTSDGFLDEDWEETFNIEVSAGSSLYNPEAIHWQQDDYIFSYRTRNEVGDTITELKIYTLDGQLETQFDVIPLYSFFWFFTDAKVSLDDELRLTIPDFNSLKRYLREDILDTSFGDNGTAVVFNETSSIDSFYSIWLNTFYETSDEGFIYSNVDLSEDSLWYQTELVKVDKDGLIDMSFGDNGYYRPASEYYSYVFDVINTDDEGYKIVYSVNDTTTNNASSKVDKLSHMGDLEFSYDISHFYSEKYDTTHYLSGSLFEGPGSYSCAITYAAHLSQDSTTQVYDYYLHRFLPSGKVDSSFAEDGQLELDFVPGNLLYNSHMDDEYNIYLVRYDSISFAAVNNRLRVTKLRAESIWPELNRPSNPQENFTIYPNPSEGDFKIKYEGNKLTDLTVSLFDIQGRLVYRQEITELNYQDEIPVYNYTLSPGSYIIRVRDKDFLSLYIDKVLIVR